VKEKPLETKWRVLFAVMLGTFMAPLDGSIVNTVLPAITQYFHTDISVVQWVPTIYLLTISCLILLYGRLGDMVGYKKIFIFGLAAFTGASVLCGASQSIWMLIAFRAVQGLAAGMMMAVGFAIVTAAFPPMERGKAMGIYAICISIALGLGPSLGGIIAQHLNWRYVFFINLPIGIASVLWGSRVIPKDTTNPNQRLDVAGAITAFVFLTCFLLMANKGQSWGWTSPLSVLLLAGGLIFLILFFWIERTSKQPMLDLTLFASRRFSFASLSAVLSFMSLFAVVFLTPFYLVFVLQYDIFKVGMVMAASPIATLFVAPVAGSFSDRVGTRGLATCGMGISALGLFSFFGLDASSTAFDVIWRLCVIGVGMGLFQSPNNSAVMGSVPPRHLGIASGMLAASRNVGMVLGIAVSAAVLYNYAPVASSLHPGQFNDSEILAFLNGLHWSYITGGTLAALGAVTSLAAVDQKKQIGRANT
jgi:EmrB/QacA subfamily drug resistance transporter